MARPTQRPRLSELDPVEIEALVLRTIDAALAAAGSALTVRQRSELGLASRQVTIWAKTGWSPAGWYVTHVENVLTGLVRLLYAGAHGSAESRSRDDIPVTDGLGLACVALGARIALERDEPVTAKQLAVLAGCDPQHVRLVARNGELRIERGRIAARDAKKWLKARN